MGYYSQSVRFVRPTLLERPAVALICLSGKQDWVRGHLDGRTGKFVSDQRQSRGEDVPPFETRDIARVRVLEPNGELAMRRAMADFDAESRAGSEDEYTAVHQDILPRWEWING